LNEVGEEGQEALDHIYAIVVDMMDEGPICWVNMVVMHPHATFCCLNKMLSNREWQQFKANLHTLPKRYPLLFSALLHMAHPSITYMLPWVKGRPLICVTTQMH
jgi:hypothetical protein